MLVCMFTYLLKCLPAYNLLDGNGHMRKTKDSGDLNGTRFWRSPYQNIPEFSAAPLSSPVVV